ncbi:hypothetical protein RI367_000372 [Sorochytrium milnesiophthora]
MAVRASESADELELADDVVDIDAFEQRARRFSILDDDDLAFLASFRSTFGVASALSERNIRARVVPVQHARESAVVAEAAAAAATRRGNAKAIRQLVTAADTLRRPPLPPVPPTRLPLPLPILPSSPNAPQTPKSSGKSRQRRQSNRNSSSSPSKETKKSPFRRPHTRPTAPIAENLQAPAWWSEVQQPEQGSEAAGERQQQHSSNKRSKYASQPYTDVDLAQLLEADTSAPDSPAIITNVELTDLIRLSRSPPPSPAATETAVQDSPIDRQPSNPVNWTLASKLVAWRDPKRIVDPVQQITQYTRRMERQLAETLKQAEAGGSEHRRAVPEAVEAASVPPGPPPTLPQQAASPPVEHSLTPDPQRTAVQRVPLDAFDTPEDDQLTGLADMWNSGNLASDADIVELAPPAPGYSKYVADVATTDIMWKPCLVLKYNREHARFYIRWNDRSDRPLGGTARHKWVSRLNLLFERESKDSFYARLERAVTLRAQFEDQQVYHQAVHDVRLTVTTMPHAQAERIQRQLQTFIEAHATQVEGALPNSARARDETSSVQPGSKPDNNERVDDSRVRAYMDELREHYVFCMKLAYVENKSSSMSAAFVRERRIEAAKRSGSILGSGSLPLDWQDDAHLTVGHASQDVSFATSGHWRFRADFAHARRVPLHISDAAKRLALFLFTGNAEIQQVLSKLYACLFEQVLAPPAKTGTESAQHTDLPKAPAMRTTAPDGPFIKSKALAPLLPMPYYVLRDRLTSAAESSKVKLGAQWPRLMAQHILDTLSHVFNFSSISAAQLRGEYVDEQSPQPQPPPARLGTSGANHAHSRSRPTTHTSVRAFHFLRLVDMVMADQLRHVVCNSLLSFLQLLGMHVVEAHEVSQQQQQQSAPVVQATQRTDSVPHIVRTTFKVYASAQPTASDVPVDRLSAASPTAERDSQSHFVIYSPVAVPALIPILAIVYIWIQDGSIYPPPVDQLGNILWQQSDGTLVAQPYAPVTGNTAQLNLLPPLDKLNTLLCDLFQLPVASTTELVPKTHRAVLHHLYVTDNGEVPASETIGTLRRTDTDLLDHAARALQDLTDLNTASMDCVLQQYRKYEHLLAATDVLASGVAPDVRNEKFGYTMYTDHDGIEWPELDRLLSLYRDAQLQIDTVSPEQVDLRPFLLDVTAIKRVLLERARSAFATISNFVQQALSAVTHVAAQVHGEIEGHLLVNVHADLTLWLQLSQYVNEEYPRGVGALNAHIRQMKTIGDLLHKHHILQESDVSERFWRSQGYPAKLQHELEQTHERLADAKAKFTAQVNINRQYIDASTADYEAELLNNYTNIENAVNATTGTVRDMCRRIQSLRTRLDKLAALVSEVNEYEQTLHLSGDKFDRFHTLCGKFEHYEAFWTLCHALTYDVQEWMETIFEKIDPVHVSRSLAHWKEILQRLSGVFGGNPLEKEAVLRLQVSFDDIARYQDLIAALRNPFLCKRHWRQMTQRIGINANDMSVMTLRQVLALELELVVDVIGEVSAQATREHEIETALDELKNRLSAHAFSLETCSVEGCWLVTNFDEAEQVYSDVLLQVQRLLTKPDAEGIRPRIESFLQSISCAHQILVHWAPLQVAVENIHFTIQVASGPSDSAAPPTKPEELGPFDAAIRLLQIVSSIVERNNKFTLLILRSDLLRILTSLDLTATTRLLEEFLGRKHNSFPRLGLLSPTELVNMYVGCCRDVTAVNQYIPQLFPGLSCLVLKAGGVVRRSQDLLCGHAFTTVTAAQATNTEILQFRGEVVVDGPLEEWLGKVERAICEAMRVLVSRWAPKSSAMLADSAQVPSQVVLLVKQLAVTQSLSKLFHDPMVSHKEVLMQLQKDYELVGQHVRSRVTAPHRKSFENILLYLNRAMTIAAQMKTSSEGKHAAQQRWESEPRFYQSSEGSVRCKVLTFQMDYAFDFVGDVRIVLMPSSGYYLPRIVDSVQQCLIPVLSSEARMLPFLIDIFCEFAQNVGKAMVHLPCNIQTNTAILERRLNAAMSSQLWCCISSVEHLRPSSMSSLLGYMLDLQRALAKRKREAAREMAFRSIRFDPTNALLCIVSSTAVAEGFDTTRSLFRRVAVATPNPAQSLDVMLFSAGLKYAHYVALRLHSLLRYASRMCSIRSFHITVQLLGGIIRGSFSEAMLQQQHPETDESSSKGSGHLEFDMVARLLYAELAPYLSPQEQQRATLRSLFRAFGVSGIDKLDQSIAQGARVATSSIRDTVVRHMRARRLLMDERFVQSCIYAVNALRTCGRLAVTGPAMTGKSCLIDIAAQTLASLKAGKSKSSATPGTTTVLHTNALTAEAALNLVDGLCQLQDKDALPRVVVLDGPLTGPASHVFEQLLLYQTVTLPSGRRFHMPLLQTCIAIETDDLGSCSPAVLASCPVIHLSVPADNVTLITEQAQLAAAPTFSQHDKLLLAFISGVAQPLLEDLQAHVTEQPLRLAACCLVIVPYASSLLQALPRGHFERLTISEAQTWCFAALMFSLLWTLPIRNGYMEQINTRLRKYWNASTLSEIAKRFELDLLTHNLAYPVAVSAYSLHFDIVSLSWKQWEEYEAEVAAIPQDVFPSAWPLVRALGHHIRHASNIGQHIFLQSHQDCGKSVIVAAALKLASAAGGLHATDQLHLHISSQHHPTALSSAILRSLIKRGRHQVGTVSGRRLLCLLDDLQNVQPGDGRSQEQLRQLLETRSVYSSDDAANVTIEQLSVVALASRIHDRHIPKRLSSKFLQLFLPLDGDAHLHCLLQQQSSVLRAMGPSISPLPDITYKLHCQLRTALPPDYCINSHCYAQVLQSVATATSSDRLAVAHLWGHAVHRVYGDRLTPEHAMIVEQHLRTAMDWFNMRYDDVFRPGDPVLYMRLTANRHELLQIPPFERQASLQRAHSLVQQHQMAAQAMATIDLVQVTPQLLRDCCRLSYAIEILNSVTQIVCELEYPAHLLLEATAAVLGMELSVIKAEETDPERVLKPLYLRAHQSLTPTLLYCDMRSLQLCEPFLRCLHTLLEETLPVSWVTPAEWAALQSSFGFTEGAKRGDHQATVGSDEEEVNVLAPLCRIVQQRVKIVVIVDKPIGVGKAQTIRCSSTQSVRAHTDGDYSEQPKPETITAQAYAAVLSTIAVPQLHSRLSLSTPAREIADYILEAAMLQPNTSSSTLCPPMRIDKDSILLLNDAKALHEQLRGELTLINDTIKEEQTLKLRQSTLDSVIKALDNALADLEKSVTVARLALDSSQKQAADLATETHKMNGKLKLKMAELSFKIDDALNKARLLREDDMFEIKTILHPSEELRTVTAVVCRLLGFPLSTPYVWEDVRHHLFDSQFLARINQLDIDTCDVGQLKAASADMLSVPSIAISGLFSLSSGAGILGILASVLCQYARDIEWAQIHRQLLANMMRQSDSLRNAVRDQQAHLDATEAEKGIKQAEWHQLKAQRRSNADSLVSTSKKMNVESSRQELLQSVLKFVSTLVGDLQKQEQCHLLDRTMCMFALHLGGLLQDTSFNAIIREWEAVMGKQQIADYRCSFWQLLSPQVPFSLHYIAQGLMFDDHLTLKVLCATRPNMCVFVYDPDEIYMQWHMTAHSDTQVITWDSGPGQLTPGSVGQQRTLVHITQSAELSVTYQDVCRQVLHARDTHKSLANMTVVFHTWHPSFAEVPSNRAVDFSISGMSERHFETLTRAMLLSLDADKCRQMQTTAATLCERLQGRRHKLRALISALSLHVVGRQLAGVVADFVQYRDTERADQDALRPLTEALNTAMMHEPRLTASIMQHLRRLHRTIQALQRRYRVSAIGFPGFARVVHGVLKTSPTEEGAPLVCKLHAALLAAVDPWIDRQQRSALRFLLLLHEADMAAESEKLPGEPETENEAAAALRLLAHVQQPQQGGQVNYMEMLGQLQQLLPGEYQNADFGKGMESLSSLQPDMSNPWEALKGAQYKHFSVTQKLIWALAHIPARLPDTAEACWDSFAAMRRPSKPLPHGSQPRPCVFTVVPPATTTTQTLLSVCGGAGDVLYQIRQITQHKSAENIIGFAIGGDADQSALVGHFTQAMLKGKVLVVFCGTDMATLAKERSECYRLIQLTTDKKRHQGFSLWFVQMPSLVSVQSSAAPPPLVSTQDAVVSPVRLSSKKGASAGLVDIVRIAEDIVFSDATSSLLGWDLLISVLALWPVLDQLVSGRVDGSAFQSVLFDSLAFSQLMVNVREYLLKQPDLRDHKGSTQYIAHHMTEMVVNSTESVALQRDLRILWSDMGAMLMPFDQSDDRVALLMRCHSLARMGDVVELRNLIKTKISSDLWEKIAAPTPRHRFKQCQRQHLHDLYRLSTAFDPSRGHHDTYGATLRNALGAVAQLLADEDLNRLEQVKRATLPTIEPISSVDLVMFDGAASCQALLATMRYDIASIEQTLRTAGALDRMTGSPMHDVAVSLSKKRVPTSWLHQGFPTQIFVFEAWLASLAARIQYLLAWYTTRQSGRDFAMHDCSKVFDPRAIISAILFDCAEQYKDCVDELQWDVLILGTPQLTSPDRGFYLTGFYLDNAVWDSLHNQLKDAPASKQFHSVHCIWLKPSVQLTPLQSNICPSISTPLTVDQLDDMWIGNFNLSTNVPARHWVQRSVAFILELPLDHS